MAGQKPLQQHESEWQNVLNGRAETGELEQSRIAIAEGRSFAYLVMFAKLVVRQGSIDCIGILSLLIVKKKGHNVIF